MTWVVAAEGKGLDFVLEVHVAGGEHEQRLRAEAERRLAEALAEIERLKRS